LADQEENSEYAASAPCDTKSLCNGRGCIGSRQADGHGHGRHQKKIGIAFYFFPDIEIGSPSFCPISAVAQGDIAVVVEIMPEQVDLITMALSAFLWVIE
jgi:hypothetical protein